MYPQTGPWVQGPREVIRGESLMSVMKTREERALTVPKERGCMKNVWRMSMRSGKVVHERLESSHGGKWNRSDGNQSLGSQSDSS